MTLGVPATDDTFKMPPRRERPGLRGSSRATAGGYGGDGRSSRYGDVSNGQHAESSGYHHLGSVLGYGEGDTEMEGSLADAAFPPPGSRQAEVAGDSLDEQVRQDPQQLWRLGESLSVVPA